MNADKAGITTIRLTFICVYSRLILAAVMAATLVATPGSVVAQVQELDPATLIEGLAKEGMGELLLHLVETEKPQDPVVARQVELAGLRLEYQRVSALARRSALQNPQETKALRAQPRQAFDRLAQASRSLIKEYYSNDRRPIWQTDLAQDLLLEYLQGLHQSAPLFAEFGVTTREQQAALAEAGPEALALLVDAKLRLFKLRGEVGRDPARSQALQNSGLFFRLFDEYDGRRTPYFLAQAAFLVAGLPEDSPYFKALGTQDGLRIPNQQGTPDKERARLLELADRELVRFTGDIGDFSSVRDASVSLRARVLLARGRPQQAVELAQELIDADDRGIAWLTARLMRGGALHQMGRTESAIDELNQLRVDPAVIGDLRFGLLVTDATHRVMLDYANQQSPNKRDAAVARSYDPYLELLSGPIPGEQVKGLRDFIYQRWESTWEDTDRPEGSPPVLPPVLPPVVRLAVSQVLRQQGQEILEQLDSTQDGAAVVDGGESEKTRRDRARRMLERAITLAGTLTSEQTDPEIRSGAMFNQAMAMHWLSPKDGQNRLELTGILTDLGEQMPGQPVAEDAIAASVLLLRELHQVLPTPAEVEQAYERAAGVLFSKFPVSAAADGERLYYGYSVLQSAGRYRDAIEIYQRVPFDHDDYFQAQRQVLISLNEVYKQAQPTGQPRARRSLDTAMKRVLSEAETMRDSQVNPDRARAARRAAGTAVLIRAGLAMGEQEYDAVLKELDGFEQAYPGEDDLISQALEHRIVALTDAGRHEALAVEAKRMLAGYPDQAASVIDSVLSGTDLRIDRLVAQAATADSIKRKALLAEVEAQAQAGAVLSGFLLEWAGGQSMDARELMPFEVIRAKTLRLSGQVEPAAELLGGLIREFPDDVQVMLEYAQALYDRGDEDSLIEAVRYYDRLITGLGQPFPHEWWVAWMRRLQINDRLNEGTAEIPLRVRQLRMTDPNLGGPVTKQELERLEFKYSR
jgi:tetratricopeptide (TPR) repeat protein